MAGNKQQQQQQKQHHRVNGNGSISNGMIISNGSANNTNATTTTTTSTTTTTTVECFNCHRPIKERYLLKALDQYWHEDCLKCSCCDCRLGEVGSTLFTKANLILCKRDYLRLFGNTGFCSACNKTIPGFEMVMRAKSNVYHLECFSCFQCHQKFCVGDRFYLHENKILCEYDFEERMVFANLSTTGASNRAPLPPPPAISGHHLPRTPPGHHHSNHSYHHPDMMLNNNRTHHNSHPHPHHHVTNGIKNIIINNNNKDGPDTAGTCDVSSGYGSGDSPFDH